MNTCLIKIEHFGYDFTNNENARLVLTNDIYHWILLTPQ